MGLILIYVFMNPIIDFTAGDHAVMLCDQVRLEAYHRAILTHIQPSMRVVEVGTGTGILSAYAAMRTKQTITAIEFDEGSAQLAEDMMKAAGFHHVEVKRGKSTDVTVSPEPQALITETIGAIGPEENIVEICYDFKQRHPGLSVFLPARLKVFVEPIISNQVIQSESTFYDYFSAASFGTFDYQAVRPALARKWTSQIRYDSLSDAQTVGNRYLLADYQLGVTQNSEFEHSIDVTDWPQAQAMHFYFEAHFDADIVLTSHFSSPSTHWRNAYVSKPAHATTLQVAYRSSYGALEVSWNTKVPSGNKT
jgi:hypothetical protein